MESKRGHTPQVIRTKDLKPYPNSLQPDFYLPTEEDAKHRIRNDSTDSMISTYITTGLTVSSCAFRCLLVATIATMIMAVVSCALAVQLWFRCDEMETRLSATKTEVDASKDMPKLCLPCEELAQVPLEEDKLGLELLDRQTENNTDICCATTSQQTLTLLNLYVARRRIVTEVTETQNNVGCNCSKGTVPMVTSSTNGRVSAHLLVGAYATKRSSEIQNLQPVRQWTLAHYTAHLVGLTLAEGKLIVPETGLYFLYSQVTFLIYYDTTSGRRSANQNQSLYHVMYRYNVVYPNGGQQELSRRVTTQKPVPSENFGIYTSYMGANFYFKKGDAIYVKVSHFASLLREPEATYFGIYRL